MPTGDSRPLSSSVAATSTSSGSIRQASARAWPVAVTKPASAARASRPPRTRACSGDRGGGFWVLPQGLSTLALPSAHPVIRGHRECSPRPWPSPRLTSWISRAVAGAGHLEGRSWGQLLRGASSGRDPGVGGLLASGLGGSALECCCKCTKAETPRDTGGAGTRGSPLFRGASANTHGKRRPAVWSPCYWQEVTAALALRAPPGPAWYLVGARSRLGPGHRCRCRPCSLLFHTGLAAGCCGPRGEAGCELGQPATP